jgi:hypothetical protein
MTLAQTSLPDLYTAAAPSIPLPPHHHQKSQGSYWYRSARCVSSLFSCSDHSETQDQTAQVNDSLSHPLALLSFACQATDGWG